MIFYRYKIDLGWWDTKIKLEKFILIKETPCGFWIASEYYKDHEILKPKDHFACKWISKKSRSRYAYPSEKEALTHYIKRTKRYIEHLERRLINAKKGLSFADTLQASTDQLLKGE